MASTKHHKFLFLVQQALLQCRRQYSVKKKVTSCDKALEHFDDFYGNYFGGKWLSMRTALMKRKKYAALVNNFGDTDETMKLLENRGAHNMLNLYNIQKEFDIENNIKYEPLKIEDDESSLRIKDIATAMSQKDIASVYPSNVEMPAVIHAGAFKVDAQGNQYISNTDNNVAHKENLSQQMSSMSLASSISQGEMDLSRIISPDEGFSSTSLHQHIPATKLHGLEDWVPESSHFQYYSDVIDFPLIIEPEEDFQIPEHLIAYCYESENMSTFPEPARSKTGVVNYYLMDGSSLLPVLALDLRGGESVLDMCAAPGGKSLAILQTLQANRLHSNDTSLSRVNRMKRIFDDYLYASTDSDMWENRLDITVQNGLTIVGDQVYNRVLVDVPCTSDRLSVTEVDNNIFRADRIKERLRIPEMQASLLKNALKLVKVGGVVVYSTCSLSPVQNDGVVHMALKSVFETEGITAVIKDLSESMFPLRSIFSLGFGTAKPKYGQLVIPLSSSNYGPAYFAKIVRVK